MSDDGEALDPLRLCRALVDEVRLLPDDERHAVLQGAALRRDLLALARASGPRLEERDVRASAEWFRRGRGLLRAEALAPWLRDRGSHPEDFARWIRDEALIHRVTLAGPSLAPREISDFARVAEGTDALWSRARRACLAPPSTRADDDVAAAYFSAGGRTPPNDLDAWAQARGFEGASEAVAAMRARVADAPASPVPPAPLGVGDDAPELTLHGRAAGPLRLRDLAGHAVVLCLAADLDDALTHRARWSGAPQDAMVICHEPGDDGPRVPWLCDPTRALARALALSGGGWHVVLGPSGRIAAITRDPAEAARAFDALRVGASETDAPAPVLVVPEVFSPDECASLIARWRSEGHVDGAVTGLGAQGVNTWSDAAIKRRRDHVIAEPSLDAWIMDRLHRRVAHPLLRAFHFRVTSHEAFRLGCYDARDRGGFEPHRDDDNPAVASRRFALSVNLNPGEYDGGRLHLPEFGALLHPPRGAAVVYSASLLHAVTEVTRGQRFALVGFFRGEFRTG